MDYFDCENARRVGGGTTCFIYITMLPPKLPELGDNSIKTSHLGWCIVGYMVRNFVLRRHINLYPWHGE